MLEKDAMPYHDLTGKQAAKASPFTEYSIPNTLIIFYKGQCNFLPRHCPFFLTKVGLGMSFICPLFFCKLC